MRRPRLRLRSAAAIGCCAAALGLLGCGGEESDAARFCEATLNYGGWSHGTVGLPTTWPSPSDSGALDTDAVKQYFTEIRDRRRALSSIAPAAIKPELEILAARSEAMVVQLEAVGWDYRRLPPGNIWSSVSSSIDEYVDSTCGTRIPLTNGFTAAHEITFAGPNPQAAFGSLLRSRFHMSAKDADCMARTGFLDAVPDPTETARHSREEYHFTAAQLNALAATCNVDLSKLRYEPFQNR